MVEWTDALVKRLRKLSRRRNGKRKPAQKIAEILERETGLRFSKNAVIGKQNRLGLLNQKKRPPKKKVMVPKAEAMPEKPPGIGEYTIASVPFRGCKWPMTADPPHRFCGAKQAQNTNYSFCDEHLKKAIRA